MKRLLLSLTLLTAAAACQTPSTHTHWSRGQDLARSVQFHMLGWDGRDGQSYRDYAFEKELALSKTLKRHFLMYNPDNPWLERYDEDPTRPEDTIIPERPISGLLLLGDNFIEIFEPGGLHDDVRQILNTLPPPALWNGVFDLGGYDDYHPAPPSEFEVANP